MAKEDKSKTTSKKKEEEISGAAAIIRRLVRARERTESNLLSMWAYRFEPLMTGKTAAVSRQIIFLG